MEIRIIGTSKEIADFVEAINIEDEDIDTKEMCRKQFDKFFGL